MSGEPVPGAPAAPLFAMPDLAAFAQAVLAAAGADEESAAAATRAMAHASLLGVDSHGIRLLPHYAAAIAGGRVNGRPRLRFEEDGAVARLDADHAQGARATYAAMARAAELAGRHGIGAVTIRNSSHFGAAGAFALAAAEAGCIGFATCNSDSVVRLHDGAERFHGTNPLAVAVPVEGGRPWLLDMATSAIPYNRVLLYRSLGTALPAATASDAEGRDTTDAERAEMLAPLGAAFGFKGAGLAGLAEILSAALSGMRLSHEIAPMAGPDFTRPREMGAFVLALRPAAFVDPGVFRAGMVRYLAALRGSPVAGGPVMAPGDREWAEAERRDRDGVPVDPTTLAALATLAGQYALRMPDPRPAAG
ncbi:Ldh family oxidoreductase [Methylobacterium frigidaeris]|uniref:Oxidoreductase YjmC n=2 Tax=Methylobacterium frigidaeris TaxID=2038277 RepID=A0AA37HH72_9HYPH|nr:Ldh family oxidoreductase [Methylobacterium frigidaeris]GJD65744.1 putative oxidoreductase YjmC [Methylobacterium frigidaeris]